MKSEKKGALLIATAATLFACEAIFTKFAYQAGVNVTTTLTFRFFLASMVLIPITLGSGKGLFIPKSFLPFFLFLLSLYIGISAFLYKAYNLLPASLAIMFFYAYPAFTGLFSFFINGERLNRAKLLSLALSSLGLVLLLGSSLKEASLAGVAFALAAALVNGLDLAFYPRILAKIHQLTFIAWTFLGSTIFFGFYGIFTGSLDLHFASFGWYALIGLSLISTVGSTLALVYGLPLVGSTLTAIINTLEPPMTVFLAYLFFDERLQGWQLFGAVLVLGAIILPQIQLPSSRKKDQ